MTYSKTLKTFVVAALASLGLSQAGTTATLTLENDDPTPVMQLIIDDGIGPNVFRFSLSTTFGQADFLGLGFNFAGVSLMQSDISLVSATRQDDTAIMPDLELFGDNTGSQSDCGPGCNFNGAGSATVFDYIIRIGDNGGNPNNFVKTVVFDIATPGDLTTNPFSQIAARAQSTTNPGGSIKADLVPPNGGGGGLPPIPVPASLPLLAGAMGLGLIIARRRKT